MNQPYQTTSEYHSHSYKPWGMEQNQFCLLMHLSQFAGWIVPFGGIIFPIIMWSTNKDYSQKVDLHGKEILNFMISYFLYSIVSIFLMFFIIGFITIFLVMICSFIFTIIGAIKASNGELYRYPLTIRFIS
ncbi:DUF4870 domain-containing protein [Nonlabens tegetincola]|uniref:DUF4870 domain-containing protein n=1 Tax=Nonlabens tegetincola TaxID=323273 RepID=UPI000CF4C5C1|nr:DUF4870 domain-containing protein [Nonlabens tegetincola]PQJ19164.1 hypothetical protein BST93_05210 [Nonlabens tegetincola]